MQRSSAGLSPGTVIHAAMPAGLSGSLERLRSQGLIVPTFFKTSFEHYDELGWEEPSDCIAQFYLSRDPPWSGKGTMECQSPRLSLPLSLLHHLCAL